MEADPSPVSGIVRVLTDSAMPGVVEIGRTARGSIDARLNEPYSTGVPVPFDRGHRRLRAGVATDEAVVLASGSPS